MPHIDNTARDRIRALNDTFRTTFDPKLGTLVLTAGINSLPKDVRAIAVHKTAMFNAFTEDNDPHGEHDFGSFELAGRRFFWKIDYYDPTMECGSDDAADPEKTTRLLTIMLAEEY